MTDGLVGVEDDDRQRQHDDRERLGRQADAVDEGDERHQGRHRRRLQHDENRCQEPFRLVGKPHDDAERNAEHAPKRRRPSSSGWSVRK